MSVAIRVSPETRATLKGMGAKGDTYNDVISLLIVIHAQASKEHGTWLTQVEELWREYKE